MESSRLIFEDAARILNSGGVLVLTTDTLPGFHCRADQAEPVRRIAELKGQPEDKPLLTLAADLAQAGQVIGSLSRQQRNYCRLCWPGPFSLILPASALVPAEVTAGSGTVAVRVPAHPGLLSLLEAVGRPLVSTSVNRHGKAPALDLPQAEADFTGLVDGYYECPGQSICPDQTVRSSALLDLTVWPPQLLRSGPVAPPEPIF